eukprot:gene1522-2929_t
MASFEGSLMLRRLGFCGIDDSIEPGLLDLLSSHYPYIEWGVLFRPDMEGIPRYASAAWLDRLIALNNSKGRHMNFAAHLCHSRCTELIEGDNSFVTELKNKGFARVQINATSANGVAIDLSRISEYNNNLRSVMKSLPDIEWILQLNAETTPLWADLIQNPSENLSILFDASCGQGIQLSEYSKPYSNSIIKCGYAGGISPENIREVLTNLKGVALDIPIWIDMESSLRVLIHNSSNNTNIDCFSIDKCFKCIQVVEESR